MDHGSSTSSWKPWRWVRLDLIFAMRDIYISVPHEHHTKLATTSGNTEFKDILPWNISQMITNTILETRKRAPPFEFRGNSMKIETTTSSEFLNGGKVIVEQILAPVEINKFKIAGLWESQSRIRERIRGTRQMLIIYGRMVAFPQFCLDFVKKIINDMASHLPGMQAWFCEIKFRSLFPCHTLKSLKVAFERFRKISSYKFIHAAWTFPKIIFLL